MLKYIISQLGERTGSIFIRWERGNRNCSECFFSFFRASSGDPRILNSGYCSERALPKTSRNNLRSDQSARCLFDGPFRGEVRLVCDLIDRLGFTVFLFFCFSRPVAFPTTREDGSDGAPR